MAKAANIKKNIVRMLKKAGYYRAELTYQIEMLATNIVIFRKLSEKANSLGEDDIIIVEQARDGDRQKPHPIFAMLQAQENQLRQDIKALLMNFDKTDNKGILTVKDENPLASLMKEIENGDADDDDEFDDQEEED